MKVLHYFSHIDFAEGGVARSIVDMAITLHRAEIGCVVCCASCSADVKEELERAGVRMVVLAGPASRLGRYKGRAHDELKEQIEWADVVHMHTPWELTNVQVSKICRGVNTPYVLSTHGMFTSWAMGQKAIKKKLYYKFFTKKVLLNCAMTVQTSLDEEDGSHAWIEGTSSIVIPLPIDWELAQHAANETDEHAPGDSRARILFLSRVVSNKGIEQCIRAMPAIREQVPDVIFNIAGPYEEAYRDYLIEIAGKLDVLDHIEFLGMVKGEHKVRLYDQADLFVCPSEHENFGLVVLEALVRGTPVVITPGVALSGELRGRPFATVLSSSSPVEIASAAVDIIQTITPSVRQEAIRWVTKNYAPDVIAERYKSMYASL